MLHSIIHTTTSVTAHILLYIDTHRSKSSCTLPVNLSWAIWSPVVVVSVVQSYSELHLPLSAAAFLLFLLSLVKLHCLKREFFLMQVQLRIGPTRVWSKHLYPCPAQPKWSKKEAVVRWTSKRQYYSNYSPLTSRKWINQKTTLIRYSKYISI